MVHFPGFARSQLCIHWDVIRVYRIGFPHSEIPGSKPICGSPRLIAACHVLHRLLLPRHSPCALSSLTTKFTQHTRISRRGSTGNFHVAIACSSLHLTTEHQQAALIKLTLALLSIITTDSNLYLPNAIQLSNIVSGLNRIVPWGTGQSICPKFGATRLR